MASAIQSFEIKLPHASCHSLPLPPVRGEREPENPINPIRGSSLLDWLRVHVGDAMVLSEPDPEDWGWASEAECQGRIYLVGACAEEEVDGNHTWMLQIEKERSFWERVLGRHAMRDDDPCFARVHALIAAEPQFTDLVVEREP